MRKFCFIMRYLLLIFLIFLISSFMKEYYSLIRSDFRQYEIRYKVMLIFIAILAFIILNILDLILKRFSVKNKLSYDLINIIGILPICLLFTRILYDNTLIFNTILKLTYDKEYIIQSLYSYLEYNSFVIILLPILIIIYRLINTVKSTKK